MRPLPNCLTGLLLAVALLGATACATPRGAAEIRGKLASDAATQLDQSAVEVEQLVAYLIGQEVDSAFSSLAAQYSATLDAAGDDREAVVATVAAYLDGQNKTRESAQREGERLLQIAAKIRAGARAVEAVNAMADNEIAARRQVFDEFVATGVPDIILRIIEEAQVKHDAIRNAPPPE